MLTDTSITQLSERRSSHPYAAQGGGPRGCGRKRVIRPDASVEPAAAKVRLELKAGARLRIEPPGGGGFGSLHAGDVPVESIQIVTSDD
jgi:N-methylhydantoinase B/oxoprolinase/acetone carboxylase alpha subunit